MTLTSDSDQKPASPVIDSASPLPDRKRVATMGGAAAAPGDGVRGITFGGGGDTSGWSTTGGSIPGGGYSSSGGGGGDGGMSVSTSYGVSGGSGGWAMHVEINPEYPTRGLVDPSGLMGDAVCTRIREVVAYEKAHGYIETAHVYSNTRAAKGSAQTSTTARYQPYLGTSTWTGILRSLIAAAAWATR